MNFIKIISLIVLATSIYACSEPSNEELLINEYEQNVYGSDSDLNIKVISFEKTGEILGSDSLKFFHQEYANIFGEDVTIEDMINRCKQVSGNYSDIIEELKVKVDSLHKEVNNFDEFEKNKTKIYRDLKTASEYDIYAKSLIRAVETKKKHDHRYLILKKYKDNENELLASKYECVFSFNNPSEEGTRQAVTKIYLINRGDDKIIGAIDDY